MEKGLWEKKEQESNKKAEKKSESKCQEKKEENREKKKKEPRKAPSVMDWGIKDSDEIFGCFLFSFFLLSPPVFSRVHATLQPAPSVGRSVRRSVGPSVRNT